MGQRILDSQTIKIKVVFFHQSVLLILSLRMEWGNRQEFQSSFILLQENIVESKHHKLARSLRSGPTDRDLKPNAATRDLLNVSHDVSLSPENNHNFLPLLDCDYVSFLKFVANFS